MRAKRSRNGITLKAYAGTTSILLAMNVEDELREGLLGFAIKRKEPRFPNGRWLQGLLEFEETRQGTYQPVNSDIAPIQKFRWSDYTVYPGSVYSYTVDAVYGKPGALEYRSGPTVNLRTEDLHQGDHQIIFNRAVAASQAYSRRFGDTNPDDETDPLHLQAREWLSRGLVDKIESFIKEVPGSGWALDMAIFEFQLPQLAGLLQEAINRGVQVRVVYHAKKNDHQTEVNERFLEPLPDGVKKARWTSSIFHQKFMVLSRVQPDGRLEASAVLTGTANYTPNGVYRQANVVHRIEDARACGQYLDLFEHLWLSEHRSETKQYLNAENNPIPNDPVTAIFNPRSGFTDLNHIIGLLENAKREVLFCTAFSLYAPLQEALRGNDDDGVIRYGLQNTRSSITGTHRQSSFTVPAFLNRGLEGFLHENSKGQRGNIYIHLKSILIDYTSDNPILIVGSNNFSNNASSSNDENILIVRGDTGVADTYFGEMMRLYDHYRFRFNQREAGDSDSGPMVLSSTDRWTRDYFNPESYKYIERIRFAG